VNPLLQHLYLIRAQADLAIAAFEEVLGPIDPPAAPAGCPHPEDKRYDASTGGDTPSRWICGECLQTFEGALP
jgi:hypothetical protein